jgi:DNA-binding CsgD family transcriptional regulator
MKHAAAIAHVRQLCCLGLGGEQIMPALLGAMHDVISSESNVFQFVDQQGAITNFYHERLIPDLVRLYVSEYDRLITDDTPNLAKALESGPIAGSTRIPSKDFFRTDLYNLIFRPYGHHHMLDGLARENGRKLGAITLFREARESPFKEEEERVLARVMPYVAYALQQPARPVTLVANGLSGLVVLDREGKIAHISETARTLLFWATHPQVSPSVGGKDSGGADALRRLGRRLVAIFEDKDPGPPVLRHQNPWGRFVFRAHWLNSETGPSKPLIGVTAELEEPLEIRAMRNLRSLPLSPQQSEVGLLVAVGQTNEHIAERLRIRSTTVRDHLNKIYLKLDVSRREDLIERLLRAPSDTRY